jgi:SCY1-like protein 1
MFGPHLTEKVCEDQIFPEVAKGFTDSNEYLRELTLRSMLTLAPKLTQRTLNNSLLKYLAKLQVRGDGGIAW